MCYYNANLPLCRFGVFAFLGAMTWMEELRRTWPVNIILLLGFVSIQLLISYCCNRCPSSRWFFVNNDKFTGKIVRLLESTFDIRAMYSITSEDNFYQYLYCAMLNMRE